MSTRIFFWGILFPSALSWGSMRSSRCEMMSDPLLPVAVLNLHDR